MIFSDMRALTTFSIKQLIFRDLEEIVLPADELLDHGYDTVEAPQDPRFQIAKRMDQFVTRVGDVSLTLKSRNRGMLISSGFH